MATCSRACQPCGLSSRGAISDQELGKLRKRRCNTRGLAGKQLAGFRATPSRRITVLYGMIVYAMRFNNQLLHR